MEDDTALRAAYSVGDACLARIAPSEDWRPAEVVDRRRQPLSDAWSAERQRQWRWQYYVHFAQLNRRLDRWCDEAQLRPASDDAAHEPTAPTASPAASPRTPTASPSLPPPVSSPAQSASLDRRLTRRDRRLLDGGEDDELQYSDEAELEIEKEHAEKTKVRNIQSIFIATPASHLPAASTAAVQLSSAYCVDCWYFSPYPAPYRHMASLHLCGLCFAYFDSAASLASHFLGRCAVQHPPGAEIYRDDSGSGSALGRLSLFCVDGALSALWCQCLCLCAKLFLDHKTALFDCDQFLFFPLVRWLAGGFELLGYFSRAKTSFASSADSHNVACLLTFPHHQQHGYGRLLIAASYALSKAEGRVGRPERPLSDMGRVSYRRWWTEQLLDALSGYAHGSSVMAAELSERTAIQRDDVVAALRELDMVTYQKGQYVCTVNQRRIADWREQRRAADAARAPGWRCDFKPALLRWVPPVYPKWTTQGVRDRRGRAAADKKSVEAETDFSSDRKSPAMHADQAG